MTNNNDNDTSSCPCGSGTLFKVCCQPYLEKSQAAPTAEALMRSRYTAFVQYDEDYLGYSWHPDNRPKVMHLNAETKWLGLKIINTVDGNIDDKTGEVEFVARSKINGKASRLHENSQFARFENRWVYTKGKLSNK
ncbi:MAG: hypothetical protein COA54_12775 [Thiotrichaceae bacterium]|nr:MAG: hypothetical protein COA54_12775 [Thiotrichaceae bacterium]